MRMFVSCNAFVTRITLSYIRCVGLPRFIISWQVVLKIDVSKYEKINVYIQLASRSVSYCLLKEVGRNKRLVARLAEQSVHFPRVYYICM
jgi:hypothetical protein